MHVDDIQPGRYYSNGAYGRGWGVRLVLTRQIDSASGLDRLSYKGLAGTCRRRQGDCDTTEFARWARYEVRLNENSWQRVGYFEDSAKPGDGPD